MSQKEKEAANPALEAAAAAFEHSKQTVKPSRGRTVAVGCKMPGGMLLRVMRMEERSEATQAGYRTFKQATPIGEPVKINGYSRPRDDQGVPIDLPFPVVGGFAITFGVDAEFMETWMEQNQDLDAVRNGLIFIHEKADMVQDQAKEFKTLRNGLEPIDPETKKNGRYIDPRMPARIQKLKTQTEDA